MTPIFFFYFSHSQYFPQFALVFHIFHFSDFLAFTSFSRNFLFLSIRDVFSLKRPEFYRDRHFIPIVVRIVRDLANSQHFLRCKRDASVEQTPRFSPSVIRDFTRETLTLLPSCASPFPPHPSFPSLLILPDSLARDLHSRLIIKVWRHRVFSINIPG